jgi:putative oxidoreductase
MRKAVLVVRILLGLGFLIFGLNGILHFLPAPPVPPSDAATFAAIMTAHKYMSFVALCQVIGGLLLLVGRFVPLGLTILAPILVNILLFHFLLEPKGVVPGLVCTVLELFLLYAYRLSFRGLFDANPETF